MNEAEESIVVMQLKGLEYNPQAWGPANMIQEGRQS